MLTNRDKLRLRQALQLTVKMIKMIHVAEDKKKDAGFLDDIELFLLQEVQAMVEAGPCHNPRHGIFQFRIRSLQQQLSAKCVFYSQTYEQLPKGSVADKLPKLQKGDDGTPPLLTKPPPVDAVSAGVDQNEFFELYKYGKKIGAIRKKYVLEDRHLLLDLIEEFTPEYKATFVYTGLDKDGEDHTMSASTMAAITNAAALAIDTNRPELREDMIACMLKICLEKEIGPTWHVIVGRSVGYSITCEARHMCEFRMCQFAIVVWKSEPEPPEHK